MRNYLAKQNATKRELARIERGKKEGEKFVNTSKPVPILRYNESARICSHYQTCITYTLTETSSPTRSTSPATTKPPASPASATLSV